MRRTVLLSFLLIFSFVLQAQTVEWFGLVIIPELKDANFLIVKVDSVGPKCLRGKEYTYCTIAEEAHDVKLMELREDQESALKNVPLSWHFVSEDSLDFGYYHNKEKYRYLIDYDFDLMTLEKSRSTVIYLKMDFLLIDRQTNDIVARSLQYDLNDPFEPMELMLDELVEINQEK